ncbi:MAG: Non-specific DNA-binding protein Dps / Iron-binding ferritin-like antioxidant protein / Ferroxidase (EC [uncultured Sulfurovum sp.]|uniref:Non-specific DNA-binding protein Dps / Iron-binding ferritin-like antioxidant protein / Ferroxidase (EC) n=1 Tax=uncultured Sulfurovum sp. TaxID=269237 RepID=A0A6S6U5A7_9BACT|nr:MAG: Non-specific DNA-binding protein Dps / Iron-binding ferritin-like antioxidant protein / Ferroxidase (EC [uncultured Sulfurovum sp.]
MERVDMKTINKLKQIQADAMVMHIKLHNLHWNIKGMAFYEIHAMTETMYLAMATLFDDTAERVLQLGQKPLVTMAQAVEYGHIEETEKTEFDTKEVLEIIKTDYIHFLYEFKELSNFASELNDTTTIAFADDNIAKFEKDIWMLKASVS